MATLNIYDTFQREARLSVYLLVGPAYAPQIYALRGILSFSLAVALISIILRWRQGNAWVLRIKSTHHGGVVTPNPIVVWLLGCIVFLALMVGPYSRDILRFGEIATAPDLTNLHAYIYGMWLPLVIGAWFMAHATFLTPILSDASSTLAHYPMSLNIFFLSIPLLVLASMIPLIVKGSNDFNYSIQLFNQLDAFFTTSSATVRAGGEVNLVGVGALIVSAQASVIGTETSFRNVFIGWSVIAGLLSGVFTFAFISHYRGLGKTLRSVRSNGAGSGGTSAQDQKESAVLSAYRGFLFTVVFVILICGSYLALVVFLAVRTYQVVELRTSSITAQVVVLLSLWMFAILGTTANVGILVRSARPPPSPSRALLNTSGASLSQPNHPQFVFVETARGPQGWGEPESPGRMVKEEYQMGQFNSRMSR